jgi:DNA polymerase elongation subunit (family B)
METKNEIKSTMETKNEIKSIMETKNEINNTVEILSHAYKWEIVPGETCDDFDSVLCWSLQRNSESCLLRFVDFPAFCHVELPMYIKGMKIQWSENSCNQIYNALCSCLGDDKPIGYRFYEREKAYYFKMGQKFPMMIMMFRRNEAMKKMENRLKYALYIDIYGKVELKVWETEISMVRKLLSTRDVKYSQWFRINGTRPEEPISTCKNEFIVNRETMFPISPEQTKDWYTKPKIIAFDIETYSDNHKALPKPNSHLHCSFLISCLCKRLDDPEVKRYAIVYGKCRPVKDSIVIEVKDEMELIAAFEKIIVDYDPEILTGYNIFLYDIPYLNIRKKRNIEDWGIIGKLVDMRAYVRLKSWSSSAYGIQNLNILEMPGRLIVDLYSIVQREYKLDMYTLDFVCKKFIKKGKHDVKPQRMFIAHENMQKSIKSYEKSMTDICSKYGIIEEKDIEILLIYNKDLELLTEFKESKKILDEAEEEMRIITEYCLQDADLCIGLMEQLNVWIGLVELSNIVCVGIIDLFVSGQQIRCINQIYDLAYKRGIVIDKRILENATKFTGGKVQEPIRGFGAYIICLDFASLYPSIMMAFNLCCSTLIHPEFEKIVPDSYCSIIEFDQEEPKFISPNPKIEEDENGDGEVIPEIVHETEYVGSDIVESIEEEKKDTIIKHYRHRFIKKEYFVGLVPQLVEELVAQRNFIRKKLMKPLEAENKKMNSKIIEIEIEKVKRLENKDEKEIEQYIDLLRCTNKKKLKKNEDIFKKLKSKYGKIPNTEEDIKIINELNQQISVNKLQLVVLEARQKALKVSANSFFGLFGVHKNGKFSCLEVACSITGKGRELITEVELKVKDRFISMNPSVKYGDTDSLFFSMGINDGKRCYEIGKELTDFINGTDTTPSLFPKPLTMEMEKIIHMICFEPKLYAYAEIDEDGNLVLDDIGDVYKKGLFSARRGQSKYIQNLFDSILMSALRQESVVVAFDLIIDSISKLINGDVPYEGLKMIRGLGSNYKSPNFFMAKFSEQLKKIGKPQQPGSRLEFVVCTDESPLLGDRMKLLEDFLENPQYKIDVNYYLENVAMNPIDKIFKISYNNVLPLFKDVGYKSVTTRKKFVCVDEPIHMICRLVEDKVDITTLKDWFKSHYDNIMNPKVQVEVPKVKIRIKTNNEVEKNIQTFIDNTGNVIVNKIVL